tara:strand:+ start:408 stop:773 length:366 start_codon:yes stop_codon:yes gene_type:complete
MSSGHVTIKASAAVDRSRLIVAVIAMPFRHRIAAFWKERPWPKAITGVETKRSKSQNKKKKKPWQRQTRLRQNRRSPSGEKRANRAEMPAVRAIGLLFGPDGLAHIFRFRPPDAVFLMSEA